jgi:hypothetical protein
MLVAGGAPKGTESDPSFLSLPAAAIEGRGKVKETRRKLPYAARYDAMKTKRAHRKNQLQGIKMLYLTTHGRFSMFTAYSGRDKIAPIDNLDCSGAQVL